MSLTRWDLATAVVVVAVVVAHLSFLISDGRLPQDPGLYYRALPDHYEAWRSLDVGRLALGLTESSGWYNVLVGLAMALFGVSPLAFSAFDALWVALILVGVGSIARQLHSPAAALASVCLAGSMPVIFLVGRTSWIHTPETALVLLAVAAWCADRTLARWRTVAFVAAMGVLAVALRPSGLVWVATLAPLLISVGPRRWGRIVLVGLAWLASLAVPLAKMEQYMTAKAAARERYAAQLPGLIEQVVSNIGAWPLVVVLAGLVCFVFRRPRGLEPVAVLTVGWAAISLLLWVLFQAGIDNFPLIAPGLAILAGWGLARLAKPVALLAVPLFLAVYIPQWIPSSSLQFLHRVPGAGVYIYGSNIRNHYRVYQRYGWSDVEALIAAVCPDETCQIGVDQGLLEPFTEDIGELELFLVQADNIHLINIREGRLPGNLKMDALVEYHCSPEADAQWRVRFPDSLDNMFALIEDFDLLPAWTRPVSSECEVMWMTPNGDIASEDALPTTGSRVETGFMPAQQRSDGMKPPLPGDPPLPDKQ